jgi:hypothetical protein
MVFLCGTSLHAQDQLASVKGETGDWSASSGRIIFPIKAVVETGEVAKGKAFLAGHGTLFGREIGYKNNTVSFQCLQSTMRCSYGIVQEIGPGMTDEISVSEDQVIKWDADHVEFVDDEYCTVMRVTVIPSTEEVSVDLTPAHITEPICAGAPKSIRHLAIGDSPYWRKVKAGLSEPRR